MWEPWSCLKLRFIAEMAGALRPLVREKPMAGETFGISFCHPSFL